MGVKARTLRHAKLLESLTGSGVIAGALHGSQLQRAHISAAAPAGHPDGDGELADVGHFDALRRAGASGGDRPKVQARGWPHLPPGTTTPVRRWSYHVHWSICTSSLMPTGSRVHAGSSMGFSSSNCIAAGWHSEVFQSEGWSNCKKCGTQVRIKEHPTARTGRGCSRAAAASAPLCR